MLTLMRNAAVSALISEFLFDVYRLIEAERQHNVWLPDEDGVLREAFDHRHTSCWEWSTSVLEEVGAIKALRPPPQTVLTHIKRDPNTKGPYSYPAMALEECRAADFSSFETFDNYCYAMFTFWQLAGQMSERDDIVNLAVLSPRFMEAVATKDDIFLLEGIYRVKFRDDRFEQKVMMRWREMDIRMFRHKERA